MNPDLQAKTEELRDVLDYLQAMRIPNHPEGEERTWAWNSVLDVVASRLRAGMHRRGKPTS
jgi:hypothetical protein